MARRPHVRIRPADWGPRVEQEKYGIDHYDAAGRWTGTTFAKTWRAAQRKAAQIRRLIREDLLATPPQKGGEP
jgi:hypothetical protein